MGLVRTRSGWAWLGLGLEVHRLAWPWLGPVQREGRQSEVQEYVGTAGVRAWAWSTCALERLINLLSLPLCYVLLSDYIAVDPGQ